MEDMQIIYVIFAGSVIIEGAGKLYCRANRREKGRAMADPAWSEQNSLK